MSTTNSSGGTNTTTSGSGEGSTQGDPEGQNGGTYPAHFVDKLKKEKQSQAQRLADLTKEIEALKAAQAESQTKELEKQQQYKALWEQEKARADGLDGNLKGLNVQITEGKKRSAIKAELLKLGLNPKHESTALRLMDVTTVIVDDQTGAVVGAEEAAKAFHLSHKDLGIFGTATAGVSHAAPGANQKSGNDFSKMKPLELREALAKNFEQGGFNNG